MPISAKEAARVALTALSEEERRLSAVYLRPEPLEAGEGVPLRGTSLPVRASSFLAFIDLQPGANWGHPCRYLLLAVDDGSLLESVEARFPPSAESIRLVHRGPAVEDWTLLTEQPLAD